LFSHHHPHFSCEFRCWLQLPCLICVLSVHPVLRVRVVSDWRPPAVHSHSHSAYPQHGNCTAPVAAAPPSHSIVPLVPLLLFAFVCLCRSVRTIPVRWSSVLTTRRRHSRVIFPPLLVCAQFLFVFLFATTWTPSVLTSRPPACVVANDAPSG